MYINLEGRAGQSTRRKGQESKHSLLNKTFFVHRQSIQFWQENHVFPTILFVHHGVIPSVNCNDSSPLFLFIAPKASPEGACILTEVGDCYGVCLVTVIMGCVVTVMLLIW